METKWGSFAPFVSLWQFFDRGRCFVIQFSLVNYFLRQLSTSAAVLLAVVLASDFYLILILLVHNFK